MTNRRYATPVTLPLADPEGPLEAAHKGYADRALDRKVGKPYVGMVPSGSASVAINHGLGTFDVDVVVWRTSDHRRVGVPAAANTPNSVVLTFSAPPTGNQYGVMVSSGVGTTLQVEQPPHASLHLPGADDGVAAAAMGMATAGHAHPSYAGAAHDHGGVYQGKAEYSPPNHTHAFSPVDHEHGVTNYVPEALKPFPPVLVEHRYHQVSFLGGYSYRSCVIDASQGNHFRIDVTIDDFAVQPPNPFYGPADNQPHFVIGPIINGLDGQVILLEIRSLYSSAGRGVIVAYGDERTFANDTSPALRGSWLIGTVRTSYDDEDQRMNPHLVDYFTLMNDHRAAWGSQPPGHVWYQISHIRGFPA